MKFSEKHYIYERINETEMCSLNDPLFNLFENEIGSREVGGTENDLIFDRFESEIGQEGKRGGALRACLPSRN